MAPRIPAHHSLKSRLVLTTLAIFLLSLWALSFYSSYELQLDTERLLGQQQLSTVRQVATLLGAEVEERVKGLQMVAAAVPAAAINDTPSLQRFLDQRLVLHSLFNNGVVAYDLAGNTIAASPLQGRRLGTNYMDRDYVAAALRDGMAIVGRPVIGRTSHTPVIGMAVPLFDAQHRIVGAIGGLTKLGIPNFIDRLTDTPYGAGGSYFLVAPRLRLVVTATDKGRIMQDLPPRGSDPLIDRFGDGYEGSGIMTDSRGVSMLASAHNVGGADWYIAAALPIDEAFQPIREMQQRMLHATIVLTLLAVALTWWIIRRQFAPLVAATGTLAGMADNNAPLRPLPIANNDEIGLLCGGFNRLLDTLGKRERALQESEANFRLIFENSGDAILLSSADGAIVSSNPAACRMFGYTNAEFLALGRHGVVDLRDMRIGDALRARRESGRYYGELRCIHRDGHPLDVEINSTLFTDLGGQTRLLTLLRDISERKRSEAELEQHRHHLTELVNSRTAELAEAKEAAESASRAKSLFLANMSHEIRTPMNAILGMANVLRRAGVTPAQAERLDKINAASEHLLGIINDILDLSKIEAGKLALEEMPVELEPLLQQTGAMLLERAAAKGLQLSVQPVVLASPTPATLYGDATRLQQALLNYATNAIKFTDSGSVTLRAIIEEENDDSLMVRFEVTDSGIGIEPQSLARLFDPFEQADNSTTRKYGGTGLGLAITRRLAELMDGSAGAQSTPGVGSTFWFTARLSRRPHHATLRPSSAVAGAEMQIRRAHRGRRILIVDDDPMNLEVARCLLEDAGLAVSTAVDGNNALLRVQEEACAAVLMDMQMPNMDGLEATRRIRQLPDCQQMPILAMTANAFAEDRANCFAAGMNDFVIKPFDPDLLFTLLLRWLDASGASPDDAQARGGRTETEAVHCE